MKKKIIGMFVIIILAMLIFMPKSKAAKELDEIQDYTITIDMKEDGTMDMKYHILYNSRIHLLAILVARGITNKPSGK